MGLFGSPKASSISGNKFLLLPAREEGWRFILRGSWIVSHKSAVSGYHQHYDRWLVAWEPDWESLSPCFYSTNMPPSEIVSPLDTGFPIFLKCCSTFSNFFMTCDFPIRIISFADCLPIYPYNSLIANLLTQITYIKIVVCICPTFVRRKIEPYNKIFRYDRI